jgi:hypothetical protein
MGIRALLDRDDSEREYSWLDWSHPVDISADGKAILFDESGEETSVPRAYVRRAGGAVPVRIGDGQPIAFAPDGRSALVLSPATPFQILRLPLGTGDSAALTNDRLNHIWASPLPGDQGLVFSAAEPGHGIRLWVQRPGDGNPKPITPEGVSANPIVPSPDGRSVLALDKDRRYVLFPVDGSEPRPVAGFEPDDTPIRWNAAGTALYVFQRGRLPTRVVSIDAATGTRTLVREIMATHPAGVLGVPVFKMTADGRFYAYAYARHLDVLYVVEGLE